MALRPRPRAASTPPRSSSPSVEVSQNDGGAPSAPKPQSNLLVRLVTGFIGAPLILLLLYLGPAWGWLIFVARRRRRSARSSSSG